MSKEAKEREQKAREKAFRKESQKIALRGLGKSASAQMNTDKESVKTKGEKGMSEASSMINSTGSSFQESVKGQFSKKVTQVFEEQKQTLDSF
ncbi:hypothetical protein [Enterococcus sp. AZ177]|uniref:hypothetical protein n=1 Tax=unclassified Enterococcus TaxID=2608891 RepID=UPI003D2FE8D5